MVKKRHLLFAALSIWVAGFLVYSNSYGIAFQFDDTHTVQSNMYVRSLKYIPRYFVDPQTYSYRPENSGYRPMTTVALALGFALSQLDTWGYHLIKLIEHCLVGLLVMLVGLRVLPRTGAAASLGENGRLIIAWLAGLVFVAHRANTETVDYICAVSTLQAGLFHLLSFYLYLKWSETPGLRRRFFYLGVSVLVYLASMMSKEEGITLVGMIVLYEWVFRRGAGESLWGRLRDNWRGWFKVVAPYMAVAVLFVVLRQSLQSPIADTSRGDVPVFNYFITQLRSWLHYWKLFFWPVTLNADNLSFDFSTGLNDLRVWGALAVHAVVWAVAWRLDRVWRFVSFAVLWIYVTVLPASSIFPLVEAVNEHRMYIPYMFLSLLSVWALFELGVRLARRWQWHAWRGGVAALGLCVVLAVALGVGAHARNEVWRTNISLWEDVYEKNPGSVRAMNVLGVSLLNDGHVDRSLRLLERCHTMAPTYLPCIVHLGMGYARVKQFEKGLQVLQFGNQLDPNYPHINYHIGVYYKDYFARFELAKNHLKRVIQWTNGRFFQASVKLAEIALEEGRPDEAIRVVSSVLKLDQSNGDAWEVQAKALMLMGRINEAEPIFRNLLQSAPSSERFMLNYANLMERTGQYPQALQLYERAVQTYPMLIQAWQALVRVNQKIGQQENAKAAGDRVRVLKESGKWLYVPSAFMIGERRGQVGP